MKAKHILKAVFVTLMLFGISSCGEWGGLPDGYSFEENDKVKPVIGSKPTERGTVIESGTVDLGLSVKWAACNLGASYCYEYGDTYDFGNTDSNCPEQIGGTMYDHAHQELGGKWQTPSKAQWEELMDNCLVEYQSYRGVNGLIVTGTLGKAIFIPVRNYWTSTLDISSNKGYYFQPSSSSWSDYYHIYVCSRYDNLRIRPILMN